MKEPIYKVSCIVIGSKCTVMRSISQLVDVVTIDQGGYIFYAGGSIAGVSCRRRWPRLLLLS